MKQILLTLLTLLAISCQKELTKLDKLNQASLISSSRNNSISPQKEQIDYLVDETDWDNCTNDSIHLTGILHTEFNYVIVGNILNSVYVINFEGLHGIGLLSGINYIGTGHFTDEERGYLPGNGTIDIFNQNVTAKTMLVSSQGTLYSTFNIHILGNIDSIRIDRETFSFGCK